MASFTASSQIIHLLRPFASALTRPAFSKAVTLFCGVLLSPGRRTAAAALRAVGLKDDQTFGKYHRLLSRDRWSALLLSQQLLRLLVQAFLAPDQRIDLVVDKTLERRQGRKIVYKGWYRDAVRSTQNVVVTVLGVRWLCFCVLVQTPWAKRRWALPFLTFPVLSQKTCARRKRPFRGGIGLTCDLIVKVRSWLGDKRHVRLIGDGGFTSMEVITYCNLLKIVQIGRLRLDAALYDAPADQPSTKRGPKPRKGTRQPSLKLVPPILVRSGSPGMSHGMRAKRRLSILPPVRLFGTLRVMRRFGCGGFWRAGMIIRARRRPSLAPT